MPSSTSPTAKTMSPGDYALARNLMVDGQLRPCRVNDERILDAMRRIPREAYLPPELAPMAYIDEDLRVGGGRALLKPMVLARLLQLARPRAGEQALVVGAGSGYGAAVLASCEVQVSALEEDEALLAIARGRPCERVTVVEGRLADGWQECAPYDIVVIEGAVRAIPDALARQVSSNGRLVAIHAPVGGASVAVLAEPSTGGLRAQPAFDASAPLLPSLLPAPPFVF